MATTVQLLRLVNPFGPGEQQASAPAGLSQAVFDDWIRLHYEDVFRYAVRFIGNADTAADLTQECFIKAYRARASFRGDCSPKTWLLRIAINACRDWLRQHRRTRELFVALDDAPAEEAVVEADFNPLALDVRRCMASLDYETRTMLLLRFVDGLSFAEIGEIHGCSEAAAKMKVHRSKAKLRSLVERGR